jgi:hypothetical protein
VGEPRARRSRKPPAIISECHMIETNSVAVPILRKEVVATTALGEVVVCALRLSQRLALGRATSAEDAQAAADLFCARLLAASVTDKTGKPLFSEEQWDIFGAEHTADTNALVDVAMRLGGFAGDASKNG